MSHSKSERRRIPVDSFQRKLLLRMLIYWFVYQFSLWNFVVCWRLLQEGQGSFIQEYGSFVREFYPMLICFLILVPFFAWDAVKFYHRVAGPILRFRKICRDIADDGPVRLVTLRTNDELADFRDEFNAMLEALAARGSIKLTDGPTSDETKGPFPETAFDEVAFSEPEEIAS